MWLVILSRNSSSRESLIHGYVFSGHILPTRCSCHMGPENAFQVALGEFRHINARRSGPHSNDPHRSPCFTWLLIVWFKSLKFYSRYSSTSSIPTNRWTRAAKCALPTHISPSLYRTRDRTRLDFRSRLKYSFIIGIRFSLNQFLLIDPII